jgi:3-hydroxyacyl-[acyl-carrier-protein] dehydratase
MNQKGRGNLRLSSNVIELLLPQRRPFLMVDFVDSFESDPTPTLTAGRHISANESVFEGHFPGIHIWPGTLTVEGLGQTSALLMAIVMIRRSAAEEGTDPEAALDRLRNLDLAFRLHPGHRADQSLTFLQRLRSAPPWLAIGGSIEVKFLHPVFAGQRLDYRSRLIGELGDMMRFSCEAFVDSRMVAKGTLSGARVAGVAL